MASTADVLTKNGILYNAGALVSAASRTGVPLYIAAAFVEHESGGANVFGHDAGGALSGGGTVTEAKFERFLQLVHSGHTSNGVGPLQITYAGYFAQAASQGLQLWQPLDNMIFGLRIIKSYLGSNYSDASIDAAGQRYNSGRANGAPAYGATTVRLAHKWHALVGGSVTPSAPTAASTAFVAGPKTIEAWQRFEKTPVDGKISSQNVAHRDNAPASSWTTIEWVTHPTGSQLIRAAQRRLDVSPDGILGPNTAKAMQQHWLGVTADGVLGPKSVEALCRKLGLA